MYEFKVVPEALRAGAFALLIFVVTTAANFEGQNVDDWEKWAWSVATGAIAFVGAAMLGVLTRPKA